jgi:hypothetical protein
MAEAVDARAAAESAQRAAADMLESRQALAAENVELEERVLALTNAQAHAQQQSSEWESRVAAAGEGGRKAEAKALAVLARRETDLAQLEGRYQELQGVKDRLLGRMKQLAGKKSGLTAAEVARLFADVSANGLLPEAAAPGSESAFVPGAPQLQAVQRVSAEVQTDVHMELEGHVPSVLHPASMVSGGTQTSPRVGGDADASASPLARSADAAVSPSGDADRTALLRDPTSARIAERAGDASTAVEEHANLSEVPEATRALLPKLAWASGDAAGAIAETQVTVLDNIHRLITVLHASRNDLRNRLAAAVAELATLKCADATGAAVGVAQATAAETRSGPSQSAAPMVPAPYPVAHGASASDSVGAKGDAQGAPPSPAAMPAPPAAIHQTAAAHKQGFGGNGAHGPGGASAATPSPPISAQGTRPRASALPVAGAVHSTTGAAPGRLAVGAASAHATPAKTLPESGIRSAPVPPAQPIASAPPARRRGWFGGMFGGRQPAAKQSLLTVA